MSHEDPTTPSSLPVLTREDFFELDYLDGWTLVPGTRKVDDSPRWINWVTEVYSHGGRFFAVKIPRNTGDGESADSYNPFLSEVFPHSETVTTYQGKPQESDAERPGIPDLSDEMLVKVNLFMIDHWDDDTARAFSNGICWEAESRGWPDGWWEDPSVVLDRAGGQEDQS